MEQLLPDERQEATKYLSVRSHLKDGQRKEYKFDKLTGQFMGPLQDAQSALTQTTTDGVRLP